VEFPAGLIYARPAVPLVALPATRAIAALVGAGCLGVLVLAASLRPDPTGIGTHTRLGFTACSFEVRTGLPCITCGMTTSFAHFARGQLAASLYTQPAAFVLAAVAAVAWWVALYVALTGRPLHRLLRVIRPRWWILWTLALLMAAWGWKIYIHVMNLDGWRST